MKNSCKQLHPSTRDIRNNPLRRRKDVTQQSHLIPKLEPHNERQPFLILLAWQRERKTQLIDFITDNQAN
jgi:hypothetical protein